LTDLVIFPLSIVFIVALIVSLLSTRRTRTLAIKYAVGSFPDERMVHTGFVPRMGGVGIISGFFIASIAALLWPGDIFASGWEHAGILTGALMMAALGIYDDLNGMNATQKFSGQFLAATVVILSGCSISFLHNPFGSDIELGLLSIPLTYLWLIGVTNAVNLLDGLDGLAAGVSAIAAAVMAFIAALSGAWIIVVLCVALIGGLLGFLRFNYHPASIFMGDTGSLFLGFILASLSLKAFEMTAHNVTLLLPLLILAVPIGDTAVAFFRRLNRGSHPFKPDKDHLHHRLLYLGLSHRQAVHIIYGLSVMYGLTAVLIALNAELIGFVLLLVCLIFSALGLKRLGYLEAKRFRTHYGDSGPMRVEKELAPLSLKRFLHRMLLLLSDILMLNASLIGYLLLRNELGLASDQSVWTMNDMLQPTPLLFITLGWLFLFILNDLYSMRWDISRFDKVRRISKTIFFGILLLFVITLDTSAIWSQGRIGLLLYAGLLIVMVNAGRMIVIAIEKKWGLLEYAPHNTLLIGATEKGRKLLRDIRKNEHLLYNVTGFVTKDGKPENFSDLTSLGRYDDIPEIIRGYGIQELIIAINERSRDEILNLIAPLENMKVVIKIIPQMFDVVSGHKTEEVIGHPLIRLFPDHMHLWQWIVKRLLDTLIALTMLVVLMPVGLLAMALLFISGTSPALTIIDVVGKNGQKMGMLNLNVFDRENAVSRFLYKSNLYKLPALLNILIGTMSLVGPRPEKPDHVLQMREKIRFYNRRFQVRPGLTGWAQVKFRYDDSLRSVREQLKQDLFYLENMSLTFDMRILLRSLYLFFFPKRIQ